MIDIRQIDFYERDCEKPECNPPDGGPHVHFKIVAEIAGGPALVNGVRLNGRASVDEREQAKALLKEWLAQAVMNLPAGRG